MKKTLYKLISIILFAILFVFFGHILTMYTNPMENRIYDFSISCFEGEGFFGSLPPLDYNGWTFYTKEEETTTEIKADEFQRLLGLSYAGQTFYYSRTLNETLDNPTLQIPTANHTISIFLDDQLIYTDCPELDNRIGYLTLPMLEDDRTEPVTISLPLNYKGKTLTIAQSTSLISETFSSNLEVVPCSVILYCGYAYESSLIAENSQISIFSTILFCLSVLLLFIFVYKAFHGQMDIGLICMALTILLWMAKKLRHTSFFISYFGVPNFDFSYYCNYLSFVVLLFFLCSRGGRYRTLLYGFTTGCLFFIIFLMQYSSKQSLTIQPSFHIHTYLILTGFLLILLLGILFWRKETTFYRFFTPITLIGIVIVFLSSFVTLSGNTFMEKWEWMLKTYSFDFVITQLRTVMLSTGFIITMIEFFKSEIEKKTEQRLLIEYTKLAQTNYENLRQHQKQIMMLHHDMNKHLSFLQQLAHEEKVSSYLEELVGQRDEILPVIQSGNDMLDVILNGKLNRLYDTKIKVEVERTHAPKDMPLSDTDFCSLMINLMDNAIYAVTKCKTKEPYLFLDLHIKNDFWVFTCKNSADMTQTKQEAKKETIQLHGFGLYIVEKITKQYNILYQTEQGLDFYKVTLAVPLITVDTRD